MHGLDRNVGERRKGAAGGHGGDGHATEGCYDTQAKPRSHDTSRIAWAKLLAWVGEKFPLECPNCGGDIRLIAFIAEPGLIRKILTHLGEPFEPPPLAPARGPPTDWGELMQVHFRPGNLSGVARRAAHRRRLRTGNRLERLNKEIKRRTRVATLFPNETSVLRLVSAALSEISDDWETERSYLNMKAR